MLKNFQFIIRHCEPRRWRGVAISLINKQSFSANKIALSSAFGGLLAMTIWNVLLISPVYADHCPVNEAHTDFGCISNDPFKFATSIYGIGLGLIGVIGLLSIVYGAFLVLTSQGDPVKLQNGKSYIVYALIGMALGVFGFAFYRIIATNVIRLPGFS